MDAWLILILVVGLFAFGAWFAHYQRRSRAAWRQYDEEHGESAPRSRAAERAHAALHDYDDRAVGIRIDRQD